MRLSFILFAFVLSVPVLGQYNYVDSLELIDIKIKYLQENEDKNKILIVSVKMYNRSDYAIKINNLYQNMKLGCNDKVYDLDKVFYFNKVGTEIVYEKSKKKALIEAKSFIIRDFRFFTYENSTPLFLLFEDGYKFPLLTLETNTKRYYNLFKIELNSPDDAEYYMVISSSETNKWVKRYYYIENDQLEMEVDLTSLYPEIKDGKATHYFESGQIEMTVKYDKAEMKYLQFWNEKGDSMLTSGSGIVRKVKDGHMRVLTFEDSLLTEGFSIREIENDTLYTHVDQLAEYPGGTEALFKFLSRKMKYPKDAKQNGIEGKVYVNFIVDKSGNVTEIKAMQSIGGGCDEEAIRVVKLLEQWEPAIHNGKTVKVEYSLPINFISGVSKVSN